MHTKNSENANTQIWAPYMVINPGETIPSAMARHRRETGHRGMCILMGINTGVRERNNNLGAMAGAN